MTITDLPAYCQALIAGKDRLGHTFSDVAEQLGQPEVWVTALFFASARCDNETALKLCEIVIPGGSIDYICPHTGEQKNMTVNTIAHRLSHPMVVRGQAWDMPPKVS
jgi:hypothetical protein